MSTSESKTIEAVVLRQNSLDVYWSDRHRENFPFGWLASHSFQSSNQQKRDAGSRSTKVHRIVMPSLVQVSPSRGLTIKWNDLPHSSFFPSKWLRAHSVHARLEQHIA